MKLTSRVAIGCCRGGGDERQKGDQREVDLSVEKGTTVSQRSDLRGLELKTSRLGGLKDVDGVAAGVDSSEGNG